MEMLDQLSRDISLKPGGLVDESERSRQRRYTKDSPTTLSFLS